MSTSLQTIFLVSVLLTLLFVSPVSAFGAGNIASISAIEGKNWRHGDIEDMLKTVACIKGHKWTSAMVKRVYFGNWLRDYSQAMDTGTLSKVQSETIRILVWILSFLSFGYATAEYEVTAERLGVYRPEEHIDNPKNYNDDKDARQIDPRLRGPIRPIELAIDPDTGMKNYIANTRGDWATSAAYIKYSFERSIHHGRLYANGHGFFRGKDEDLAEALRCLGQGLHCLEDFGAHSNYVELVLRELGMVNVFPHTGTATAINLRGKHTFPLVTGTFGMVDFFHSVLGEASDHFTQSEINEMDNALGSAQSASQSSNPLNNLTGLLSKVPGTRGLCAEAENLQASSQAQARATQRGGASRSVDAFNQQPGWNDPNAGRENDFHQPSQWDQQSHQQQWGHPQQQQQQQPASWDHNQAPSQWNHQNQWYQQEQQPASWDHNQPPSQWNQPPPHQYQWDQQQSQPHWGQQQQYQPHHQWDQEQQDQSQFGDQRGPPGVAAPDDDGTTRGPGLSNIDPVKTVKQIYPILVFRDKVVRTISAIISKIPGLEALVDKITETLTIFILSLLAPFIRPIINGLTKQLQAGSGAVVQASGKHQYEPWTDPSCTDPTHSMLSKDHFSNILNQPAGQVASEILKFVAPRVLYAWDHSSVPVQQVVDDCIQVFHHPAIRNHNVEVQRKMFDVVQRWAHDRPGGAHGLNDVLSSEGVRGGRNHTAKPGEAAGHSHGGLPPVHSSSSHHAGGSGSGGGSSFNPLAQLSNVPGMSGVSSKINKFSSFVPGGLGKFGGGGNNQGRRRDLGDLDDDNSMNTPDGQTRGLEQPIIGDDVNPDPSEHPAGYPPPAGYEAYAQDVGGGAGDTYYSSDPQSQQGQPPYGYQAGPPPAADYYGNTGNTGNQGGGNYQSDQYYYQ